MRPKNFRDLCDRARSQPDLMGALSSMGYELERIGKSRYGEQYKLSTEKGISGDFSSVVFCWNSDGTWVVIDNKERAGKKTLDAIGALKELFGMDFDSAVYALTGTAPVDEPMTYRKPQAPKPAPKVAPPEPFVLPEKRSGQSWKGIKYLTKERLIPEPIVKNFFDLGLIYMPTIVGKETEKPIDCVGFKVMNRAKEIVGCEADATWLKGDGGRWKHIVSNSDQLYGFNFKNNASELTWATPIYFCESAVDAISLFVLRNYPGVYVSMSGLKDEMFFSVTKVWGGTPVICTDNDEAGNRFRDKYPYDTLIPEYGKDWNEELCYRVCNGMDYALKDESTLTAQDIRAFLEYEAERRALKEAAEAKKAAEKAVQAVQEASINTTTKAPKV